MYKNPLIYSVFYGTLSIINICFHDPKQQTPTNMKHLILLFSFCFITSLAVGQSSFRSSVAANQDVELSVYPNPTVDFFKVSDNNLVEQIAVYNLAGRRIKSFDYSDGEKYFVGDLPRGMYLVQLISDDRHTLATRRVSVR